MGIATTLAALALAAGCQADFAADITNRTPQPVFVRLFSRGSTDTMLAASRRLGPGDRGFLGPIRNHKNRGAYLSFDTLPNPERPTSIDLAPGVSVFEVHQDSDRAAGPLVIVGKRE